MLIGVAVGVALSAPTIYLAYQLGKTRTDVDETEASPDVEGFK